MFFSKVKYGIGLLFLASSSNAVADIVTFGSGPNQFSMEFVPIGNPGNAADATGDPNPAGSVSYNYRMGKFEVSEDMITKFNASQSLQITKDTRGANQPATSVSWNEAARFTNWLNTSSGSFAAYKFTTSGVDDNIVLWTPADTLDYDAANPFRSLRANYVLPSVNEWYKAAYYDPSSATYFDFPTGSNTAPTAVSGGTAANTAVYDGQPGPADITNAGGLSPFGVMGLGGNVVEWEETEFDLVNNSTSSSRGNRGGYWLRDAFLLSSSTRISGTPTQEGEFELIGFRVASLSSTAVPEPNSLLMVSLGTCVLSFARRRRKITWVCLSLNRNH